MDSYNQNQGYQQPQQQYNNRQPYGNNNHGYQPQPNPGLPPENNMIWAILSTLLCCLPFGIVAIVYASKVNGLWMSGLYDAARQAAKNARNWSIAAACSGLVFAIIYAILIFVYGVTIFNMMN